MLLTKKMSFATSRRYHPTKGMNCINASQTKPTRILSQDLPAIDRENPTSMPTIQSMRCGFDEEGLFSLVDFKFNDNYHYHSLIHGLQVATNLILWT